MPAQIAGLFCCHHRKYLLTSRKYAFTVHSISSPPLIGKPGKAGRHAITDGWVAINMGARMFTLGMTARDKLTGFEGIIVARAEYLRGCTQYALEAPAGTDDKPGDTKCFNECRLEVILGLSQADYDHVIALERKTYRDRLRPRDHMKARGNPTPELLP